MRFKAKKSYGESKIPYCYFCGKIATRKNDNGVEVCYFHTKAVMEEIKCTCGSWLEQRSGKFGPYFNCLNCGNINFNKGVKMKALAPQPKIAQAPWIPPTKKIPAPPFEKKEITIRSDDPEYFD